MLFLFFKDDLKTDYTDRYKMHQVHYVDENECITIKEVNINHFAMKLKISSIAHSSNSFQDEARLNLRALQSFSSSDIDISALVDDNKRVTFIRAVAGMGKSVLVKQLVCGWAIGEIYREFKLCIIFECRELNEFWANNRAKVKKQGIVDKFLKHKIKCDLLDTDGILFIIDGLDELFDIHQNESVIMRLLKTRSSRYPKSKFIITGRPNVQHILERQGSIVGGIRKLEILGLTAMQIDEYIDKLFPSRDDLDLKRAKELSKNNFQITHVPQFLNTFCCVILLKEGEVFDSTELYCWILYLLLKQHAEAENCVQQEISAIFGRNAELLKDLCKLCNDLLKENKIILHDLSEKLPRCNELGMKFVNSLFANVSDNFKTKHVFKHLSLMEFLAAIHISTMDEPNNVMQLYLKRNSLSVVLFACRLIAGASSTQSSDDIITELLSSLRVQQLYNKIEFLGEILKLLMNHIKNPVSRLRTSLEVISCFLDDYNEKEDSILKHLKKLFSGRVDLFPVDSVNLSKIYNYLSAVCCFTKNTITRAFSNMSVGDWYVSNVDALVLTENFKEVNYLVICNTSLKSEDMKKVEEAFLCCKLVEIRNCEISPELNYVVHPQVSLQELRISACKMSDRGFGIILGWGIHSTRLVLREVEIYGLDDGRFEQSISKLGKVKEMEGGLNKVILRDCILPRDLLEKVSFANFLLD